MSKKTYIKTHRNRLLTAFAAAFLALSLAIGCFPASAYAAKEMFREVTSAGVTDIDAPVAGQRAIILQQSSIPAYTRSPISIITKHPPIG